MHGLLPIIRRQRRPLVVSDAPPVVAGNVEPVRVEAQTATNEEKPNKESDAQSSSNGDAGASV